MREVAHERRPHVRRALDRMRVRLHRREVQVRSKIENAPEVTAAEAQSALGLDAAARGATEASDPAARAYFEALPPSKLREILARLTSFDGTRALVDPVVAFGRSRVVVNPWEPVPVGAVALAGTSGGEAVPWERYAERLKAQGANEAILVLARHLHRAARVFEGTGAGVRIPVGV